MKEARFLYTETKYFAPLLGEKWSSMPEGLKIPNGLPSKIRNNLMDFLDPKVFNFYAQFGADHLLPTVSARDATGVFAVESWNKLSVLKEFQELLHAEANDMTLAAALYGLARGSLDLPFASSVAAHIAIGQPLLNRFGSEFQKKAYASSKPEGNFFAIANSEPGSGSNLRLMQAKATLLPSGSYRLTGNKPCVTNGSQANWVIFSALAGEEIKLFLLSSTNFSQSPHQQNLFGFRTGATGSVEVDTVISAKESEFDRGTVALRECFHRERFFLGILVAGLLSGMRDSLFPPLISKPAIAEKQYLQEKLVRVQTGLLFIESILERVASRLKRGASWDSLNDELSALKLTLNQDGPELAKALFEAAGASATQLNSHHQRCLRDLLMLTYFGGTSELQKMNLFQSLSYQSQKKPKSRAA